MAKQEPVTKHKPGKPCKRVEIFLAETYASLTTYEREDLNLDKACFGTWVSQGPCLSENVTRMQSPLVGSNNLGNGREGGAFVLELKTAPNVATSATTQTARVFSFCRV